MKKIIIVFFGLCLLAQVVYSGQNPTPQNRFSYVYVENELSFENKEYYSDLTGTLPTAQVFFNIFAEGPNSVSFAEKMKAFIRLTIHSRNKINSNLSFFRAFLFSRYSSAVVQIFLKTACFRL